MFEKVEELTSNVEIVKNLMRPMEPNPAREKVDEVRRIFPDLAI